MRLYTSQICALYRMRLGRRRRFLFVEQIANRAGNYWRRRMKTKPKRPRRLSIRGEALAKVSRDGTITVTLYPGSRWRTTFTAKESPRVHGEVFRVHLSRDCAEGGLTQPGWKADKR